MWLRNWDNLFCAFFGLVGNSGSSFGDGSLGFTVPSGSSGSSIKFSQGTHKSVNGYGYSLVNNYSMFFHSGDTGIDSGTSSAGKFKIIVGTGTTPVTYDDFKLASELKDKSVLSHVQYKAEQIDYNNDTKTWGKRIIREFRNLSDDVLTITEIGVQCNVNADGSSGSTCYGVLVYREVLDEPLVVQPDQKFAISIPMYVQMIHHPDLA